MGTVAGADMWSVAAEAETLLDGSDCDWRTLQLVEGLLSSLSHQLVRAAAAEIVLSTHSPSEGYQRADLRGLQTSLASVRRQEYDALESELQNRLDTALRSAMATLAWLDGLQQRS